SQIYSLSLHDALPISRTPERLRRRPPGRCSGAPRGRNRHVPGTVPGTWPFLADLSGGEERGRRARAGDDPSVVFLQPEGRVHRDNRLGSGDDEGAAELIGPAALDEPEAVGLARGQRTQPSHGELHRPVAAAVDVEDRERRARRRIDADSSHGYDLERV